MQRSHKPVVWALFAAGGTVAAFVFPALVLTVSLAIPLGILPGDLLSADNIRGMLANPLVRLVTFGVLFLTVWHAAHRMRITAHDLGLRADTAVAVVLYSTAAVATVLLAAALLSL